MNWQDIKNDYIQNGTSFRQLAKKYGVSHSAISKHSNKEGWKFERHLIPPPTPEQNTNAITKMRLRTEKLHSVADRLIPRLERMIDQIPDDTPDTHSLRQLTSCLKDLKDIQMIRSEDDMREQQAKIENLLRKNEDKGGDAPVLHVKFDAGPDSWNE